MIPLPDCFDNPVYRINEQEERRKKKEIECINKSENRSTGKRAKEEHRTEKRARNRLPKRWKESGLPRQTKQRIRLQKPG